MTEKTKRVGVPWVKCDCHGPLEIIRTLTKEQAWAFMVIEKLIHHTEDRLRDDDKEMAHKMRCDVRTYRRLKNELLDAGAMVIDDGRVTIPHASAAVADAVTSYWQAVERYQALLPRPYDKEFVDNRAIIRASSDTCVYCGSASGPFEVDHIIPVSRGGTNELSNLTLACKPCNRSKGAMLVEEWRN